MNRNDFSGQMSSLLKLIRTEYSLTQDEMAVVLGISKKTLVETEKGRRSLGWTEAAALAAVFSQSNILQNAFGGDVTDMIPAIAFSDVEVSYPETMGGKIWWNTLREESGLRIQQNIISQHYRLLDEHDRKMISSFSLNEIEEYLSQVLAKRRGRDEKEKRNEAL